MNEAWPGPSVSPPPAQAAAAPTVFVRTLAVPAGAPWDQARVAGLEARVGAPLPMHELAMRLIRADPWGFGRPARYVACYVRAAEIGDDFSAPVEAAGRVLTVRFQSMAVKRRQAQRLTVLAGLTAAGALVLGGALETALAARGDRAQRAQDLALQSAQRLREGQQRRRLQAETRLLDAAGVRGHTLDDVLSDMAWAAANKSADAHVQALHWDHGYMGVEVRGDAAPFGASDRAVAKAAKPVSAGVWLWGVGPAGSAAGKPGSPP